MNFSSHQMEVSASARTGSMFGNGCVMFPMLPLVRNHLIISVVIGGFTLTTVALRIVSRFRSRPALSSERTSLGSDRFGLGWDDYLIVFALCQSIGLIIIQGLWAPMGVGYPVSEAGPNIAHFFRLLLAFEVLYTTSISTIKLSVLCFYLRVFYVVETLRRATNITIVVVSIWTGANIVQVVSICLVFRDSQWAPELILEAICSRHITLYLFIGSFNIITDIVILLLPLPTVWKLKTSKTTKGVLLAILFLGLGVTAVAMIRIWALLAIRLGDLTGTMIWPQFWSVMEPNLGVLCVSLPMLNRMLFQSASPRPILPRIDQSSKAQLASSVGGYSPDREFFSQTARVSIWVPTCRVGDEESELGFSLGEGYT